MKIRPYHLGQAALFLSVCLSQAAVTAEFKKFPIWKGGSDLIEAVGDLVQGDEKTFTDIAIADFPTGQRGRNGND